MLFTMLRSGSRALLLALFLPGCTNMRGAWSGSCDFSDGSYGEEVFLDLQIDHDHGRRIDGTARVTVLSEGAQDVDLTGEHTLTEVLLDMSIPAQGQDLSLRFTGQRDLDQVSGSCELWVPGATSAVYGTGQLAR